MAIIVPNIAATYTACGVLANTANRWTWIGFQPTLGASGQAIVYAGSGIDGSPLLPINCAAGQPLPPTGPFNAPCGMYGACIIGGSLVVWSRVAS